MTPVHICELAAWGFDNYPYRPPPNPERVKNAKALIRMRPLYRSATPIVDELTAQHQATLVSNSARPDLLAEVGGLVWSLAVVDLRGLLAFQRRLAFNPEAPALTIPSAGDWQALFKFSFAPPKPPVYAIRSEASTTVITSADPNLHLRPSDDPGIPLIAHAGSPFLEVARYRDRWFLRDGYHRAYALMQSDIYAVPAVIIEAKTLADLGAGQPQFYSEPTLFSPSPPYVSDFLDPTLAFDYTRPSLTKTIRITMKENFAPTNPAGGMQ